MQAGDEVGCGLVEELTLRVPLVLSGPDRVQVQIALGSAAADGRRVVQVHSRVEGTDRSEEHTSELQSL